ncbi:MAG TPA: hypothetical protein VF727_00925 [Allosphingosinicella sp.]
MAMATAAKGNFLVEPTYEQIMERADLVVIGTVIGGKKGSRGRFDSTATVLVIRSLKGEAPATIEVSTTSRIAEADPRCCDRGATYLMFLTTSEGRFASVWGFYGMRRIAGPKGSLKVIPYREREGLKD